MLSKHKVEHLFRVTGGAHTYAVWQRNLNEVAPMLFPD
jgi:enterochelin esterase-like enzyme